MTILKICINLPVFINVIVSNQFVITTFRVLFNQSNVYGQVLLIDLTVA